MYADDPLVKESYRRTAQTEIAEITDLEEATTAAESAVETGRDEVRLEAGALDQQKFNEMAAPIEAKHDAPWLRRRNTNGIEEIRVVDVDRGVDNSPRAKKSRMASSTRTLNTTKKERQHDTYS